MAAADDKAETQEAWQDYLDATKDVYINYREIEPWAWARLQQRLRRIKRRRKKAAA